MATPDEWLFDSKFRKPIKLPDHVDGHLWLTTKIPFFALFLNSPETFWDEIVEYLKALTGEDKVPLPRETFDPFCKFIFDHRDEYETPKTIEQAVKFIQRTCRPPYYKFFVTSFPLFLNNLDWLIRIYHSMQRKNDPNWIKFVEDKAAIIGFVDRFLPYLSPISDSNDKSSVKFKLTLSELFTTLILKNLDIFLEPEDYVHHLHKHLNSIFASLRTYDSLDFARLLIDLNKTTLPLIPSDTAPKRVLSLVNSAPVGTPSHNYIVRFAVKQAQFYVPRDQLATILMRQGIEHLRDLEVLAVIANQPGSDAQSKVVKYLAHSIICDPLWSTAAASLFTRVVSHEPFGEKEWVCLFVRRCFMLIGMATLRKKFKGKITRLIELFEAQKEQWIIREIKENARMIQQVCTPELVVKTFGGGSLADSDWSNEFDIFNKKKSNLKRFPFKSKGYDLCAIPKGSFMTGVDTAQPSKPKKPSSGRRKPWQA